MATALIFHPLVCNFIVTFLVCTVYQFCQTDPVLTITAGVAACTPAAGPDGRLSLF